MEGDAHGDEPLDAGVAAAGLWTCVCFGGGGKWINRPSFRLIYNLIIPTGVLPPYRIMASAATSPPMECPTMMASRKSSAARSCESSCLFDDRVRSSSSSSLSVGVSVQVCVGSVGPQNISIHCSIKSTHPSIHTSIHPSILLKHLGLVDDGAPLPAGLEDVHRVAQRRNAVAHAGEGAGAACDGVCGDEGFRG